MLTLIAALLPAAILVFYIYKADRLKPEPWSQLRRAIGFGVLSALASTLVSTPLEHLGFFTQHTDDAISAFKLAFWGAAVPEELAKLVMLYLAIRKNPHFDERMDGIVYAVCVSMGFAAIENVMYVTKAGDNWMAVSTLRALLSVPAHYYFGVLMGYFFALFWFDHKNKLKNLAWALGLPVFCHTLYDFCAMYMPAVDSPILSLGLLALLIVSCIQFFKWSKKSINEHLDSDARDANGYLKDEEYSPSQFYNRREK